MRAVENRLDHAGQGEVADVDRQDGRARPGLVQQGRGLLGVVGLSNHQFDIPQVLFRPGQPCRGRLDLPGVGAPITVRRGGWTREDDADA